MSYQSTKIIELGSCAFRQWRATHSHCRFLHGYQLKAKLWFSGLSLDEKNWVVDFGGLKELKSKLQQVFDHTTTVAADDPELVTFQELDRKGIIQLRIMEKGVGIERAAETVFEIANNYVKALTNGRCWVDRVEVFEHEENSAVYAENSVSLAIVSVATEDTQINAVAPTEDQWAHVQQQHSNTHTNGARVGSHVSQGMGNPFAGTSWGN